MASSSSTQPQRPIRLFFRSKEAVELYTLSDTTSSSNAATTSPASSPDASKKGEITLYKGKTTFHTLNPNGECAYIHDANVGLIKCDFNDAGDNNNNESNRPFLQDSKAILLAKCSPRGSYLLTWERANNNNTGNNGNLKVWDADTGSFVKGFSCKKATLNTLQWTHDEQFVFHMVTNEVQVYTKAFVRAGRVRCTGIASFSLPSVKGVAANTIANKESENKYLLTAFTPGTKGKPARVDLLRYPDRMGRESSTVVVRGVDDEKTGSTPSGPSLASKSLFSAEEVTVQWSPRADSALLLTQTAVDSTGESYYGSTHLFLLLENDGKRPGFGSAVSVPLPAEAAAGGTGTVPIVGTNWITNPQINGPVPFAVISGRMPALASLHHGITAEPSFLFGRAHRNVMDVSPHGRFVVCGGYGNLAGGMDFWDRNKGKRIPRRVALNDSASGGGSYVTIKEATDLTVTSCSPVVGHQWSPDSRTYLVSTTSPRMNVDNGVHIYRYDGSLVGSEKLPWENSKYQPDKLLSAEYVPAPFPTELEEKSFYYYPDRPQSPPPRGVLELKGEAAKAALTKLSSQNSQSNGRKGNGGNAAPASAYVPPAARKTGGGGGGSYVPPGARKGSGTGRGGGGSLAERMRREREGSAANVSGIKVTKRTGPVGASSVSASVVGGASGEKSKSALRREKQRLAKEKAEKEAADAAERAKEEEEARVKANKADPAKRAKKINKTLKQIDEIKKKKESGVELNDDQKKKVASEEGLRKELASLGL
mmetsp:Transcript_6263/g.13636  ORF Transcript_6263/g.13636 Transcript_6263/m.13636 type:complete len:765 (+) Transcript_6263:241-2535(+)